MCAMRPPETRAHILRRSAVVCGIVVALAATSLADTSRSLRFATDAALGTGDVGIATGSVQMIASLRPNGRETARIRIRADSLDATRNADGQLPVYGAYLIPDARDEIFLGRVRLDGRGRARLTVSTPARLFAAEGTSVRQFGGGVLEIRGAAGVAVRGAVAAATLEGETASADMRSVYGRFVAFSAPDSAPGSFILRTDEFGSGEIRNRLTLRAPGLITGPTSAAYRAYVLNAERNRVVDLGALDREPWLGASLRLDTRRAGLPGGIARWREFDGGFLEIRRSSTVMLRGSIAALRGVAGPIEPVGLARARKSMPLVATAAGGGARGILTAAVRAGPTKQRAEIRLRVLGLSPTAGPYSATVTEASGTRRGVGILRLGGSSEAIAGLRLSTARGHSIPGGSVVGLAG